MNQYYSRLSTRLTTTVSTASCSQLVFGFVNILLCIMGFILLLGAACFLRIGTGNTESMRDFYSVNIPLISFGLLIQILSVFGIVWMCCGGWSKSQESSNRTFYIYEILCIFLLLAHLSAFVYYMVDQSEFENDHIFSLRYTVDKINTKRDVDRECVYMKRLSERLHCCGYENGSSDLQDPALRLRCCAQVDFNREIQGCRRVSLDRLRRNWSLFLVAPSCVVFIIELCLAIGLAIIMGHKARQGEGGVVTAVYRRGNNSDETF
jgi:hypothetical protein